MVGLVRGYRVRVAVDAANGSWGESPESLRAEGGTGPARHPYFGVVSGCGVWSMKSSANSSSNSSKIAVALDLFGIGPDYRHGQFVMIVVAHGDLSGVESSGAERRIFWCRSHSRGPGPMPSSSRSSARIFLIRVQRIGLAAAAVEGDHQQFPQPLAQRMVVNQGDQLCEYLVVAA